MINMTLGGCLVMFVHDFTDVASLFARSCSEIKLRLSLAIPLFALVIFFVVVRIIALW